MTDEEILKAFECCCGDDVNGTHCKDCPAEKYNFDWCSDEVSREMVVYIKRLKAENAALRERLDKAIILPCKVGDIIYIITFGYNGKRVTPDNFADCWSYGMKEVEVTEDNLFIMCSHFRDGSAFFDREAAEARLKELKGRKE